MQRPTQSNTKPDMGEQVKATLDIFLDSVRQGNVFLFEILLTALLEKGFDITKIVDDKFGANALHIAANKGQLKIAEILLNMFPELVNATSKNGSTAILDACINDHFDVVVLLVSRGARPLLRNLNNDNVFSYIERGRVNKEITKYINEHQAALDQMFIKAVDENNEEGIKAALQAGANINIALKAGSSVASYTALFHACVSGNAKLVRLLLSYNPELELSAENGMTPLHGALFYGYEEIVRLLVEKGAVIDAKAKTLADGKPWMRSSLSKRLPITVIVPDTASKLVGNQAGSSACNQASNSANPAVLFSANNNNANVTNRKTVSLALLRDKIINFNENYLIFSGSGKACINAFNLICDQSNSLDIKTKIKFDDIMERMKSQIKTLLECLFLDSLDEIKGMMQKVSGLQLICSQLDVTLDNFRFNFDKLKLGYAEYQHDYDISLDALSNMRQSIKFIEKNITDIKENRIDLVTELNVAELGK